MKKSTLILTILMIFYFAYFSYSVIFLFPLLNGTGAVVLNVILLLSEMLCGLFSIYLYHSVFSTLEWKGHKKSENTKKPFVTIQVPIFNEPLSMVKKTLVGALKQNYPKNMYEIIVADDSTNIGNVNQIKKFCEKHGIKYVHRDNRHGYKAGALNNILPISKGEVIAVLDSDDMPEPTFILNAVSTLYSEDKVAFVQTRNAERNHYVNSVTGIGRLVRDLFFGAILKSKDNRQLALFCGSGGVIKKSVLKEVCGWPEATVTEDIDLSTLAFSKGYISKFINPVECRGLLPPTFTGLCRQTFRWSYGTTSTLLLRWREIMKIPKFWRKAEHFLSCMTYLLGPVIVAIDLIMVVHLLFGIPIFHMFESKTVWIFGAMLTLSSFFALMFVQLRDGRMSIKRTIDYIFVIYGLSVNFTKAVFAALFRRKFSFFRTPRSAAKRNNIRIVRFFWAELLIGTVSIIAALLRIADPVYTAQSTWVLFFGIGFLTAPYFAFRYG